MVYMLITANNYIKHWRLAVPFHKKSRAEAVT